MQAVKRLVLILAAATLLLTVAPGMSRADEWGDVDCSTASNDPRCTVEVIYTGGGNGTSGGGDGGGLVCKIGGTVVECQNAFGWLGSDGCYYGKDSGGFLPGNQWIKTCIDPATDNTVDWGVVTLLQPPVALGLITQRAINSLTIPRPAIAANPSLTARQFVHVPVWWWVQPDSWKTQTATARAGGLTITAKAVPRKITWHAGDGASKVCTGPGTPWTPSANTNAASPDCGHTYTTTSASNPNGKFTVRAVATWDISWSGGGFSGTEPAITTTTTASVTVTELRAVITG